MDDASLETNVAVIKSTVENIAAQLGKINGKMENHEDRIRMLEIWQGGERVRAGIMGIVAAVAGWGGSFLGSLFK